MSNRFAIVALCLSVCHQIVFPSELSAEGAKRGVRSLPMRTVPSGRSTQAQPAEGRPGPSGDDDDDDDGDDDDGDDNDESTPLNSSLYRALDSHDTDDELDKYRFKKSFYISKASLKCELSFTVSTFSSYVKCFPTSLLVI